MVTNNHGLKNFGELIRGKFTKQDIFKVEEYYQSYLRERGLKSPDTPIESNLVSFDGNGGSGKDTHIGLIRGFLDESGVSYAILNQKGNPFRNFLKEYYRIQDETDKKPTEDDPYMTAFFQVLGARYFVQFVLPVQSAKKRLIIINRSYISTVGYSYLGEQDLRKEVASLFGFYPKINLPFLLVCSDEDAIIRTRSRSKEVGRFEDEEFLRRSCQSFQTLDDIVKDAIKINTSEMGIESAQIEIRSRVTSLL